MFDQTHFHDKRTHITNHFKMQPHDAADAARLYGEVEKKAQENISSAAVKNFGVNNEVKVLEVATYRDPINQNTKMRLIFAINGTKHDVMLDAQDVMHFTYETIAHELFAQLVKKLSHFETLSLTDRGHKYA